MADKYLSLKADGDLQQVEATVSSTGTGSAGDIVALDSAGRLTTSVLPTGIGREVISIEAAEALTAGDLVNMYNDSGTTKVRKADNSNSRRAHGFVISAATSGNNVDVYFAGFNSGVSGGTAGAKGYLGTAGAIITTSLNPTTVNGRILQAVGHFSSGSNFVFNPAEPIFL